MAGGIPITSLQDMLMLRQAMTTDTSPLRDLGKRVGDAVAQRKKAVVDKKNREAEFERFEKLAGTGSGTGAGKGNIIRKASYDQSTGKTKLILSTPTPGERKILREGDEKRQFKLDIKNKVPADELRSKYAFFGDEIDNLVLNKVIPKTKLAEELPEVQEVDEFEDAFNDDTSTTIKVDPSADYDGTIMVSKGTDALGRSLGTERMSPTEIKALREIKEKEDRKKIATESVKSKASGTLDTIGEIKEGINNFGLTGALPSIPGTKRTVWEANVNKLLNTMIIDLMTEMKAASSTGSTGFGQLSNKELDLLKGASTVLKRTLPPKDALRYLEELEGVAQKVLTGGTDNNPIYSKYGLE